MTIVDTAQVNSTTFGQLAKGCVFKVTPYIPSETVFMSLAHYYHGGLYGEEDEYNAVDIKTGELCYFEDNEPVIPFPDSYVTIK